MDIGKIVREIEVLPDGDDEPLPLPEREPVPTAEPAPTPACDG